jgi:hypothetical protein
MSAATRLLAMVLSAAFALSSIAQPQPTAAGPERVIRDFYGWYVQALVANQDPLGKRRGELSRYATARLLREIDKMRKGPDGLDGDYFLDAQDFDRAWAKNINVSHVVTKGTSATADVELKGSAAGTRNCVSRSRRSEGRGRWIK